MATVDLNWTDNSDNEDEFIIYRATGSAPTFPTDYTQIDTVVANTTSYQDANAPDSTTVWYAVTASNISGESSETTDSVTTPTIESGSVTSIIASTTSSNENGISSESGSISSASALAITSNDVTNGEIYGTVTLSDSPVSGVLVIAIDNNSDTVAATTTTDSEGFYALRPPAGEYHVIVEYEEGDLHYNAVSEPYTQKQ